MEEWKHGRNFLLAVAEQTLKVRSMEEIKAIIKFGFENVKTNLSMGYILSYLVFATEFDTTNLRLEQLPGKSVYSNGVWIFEANMAETSDLFDSLAW